MFVLEASTILIKIVLDYTVNFNYFTVFKIYFKAFMEMLFFKNLLIGFKSKLDSLIIEINLNSFD